MNKKYNKNMNKILQKFTIFVKIVQRDLKDEIADLSTCEHKAKDHAEEIKQYEAELKTCTTILAYKGVELTRFYGDALDLIKLHESKCELMRIDNYQQWLISACEVEIQRLNNKPGVLGLAKDIIRYFTKNNFKWYEQEVLQTELN